MSNRDTVAAAIRAAGGDFNKPGAVRAFDALMDLTGVPRAGRKIADTEAFFKAVRKVTGSLDQVQVDTINRLLAAASHWPVSWLAYGLATAWHEARLKPILEIGKGRGRAYGKPGRNGGQIAYGRGLVQLTWDDNYESEDKALGLNGALVADYDKALEPDIAARILVGGMEEGRFTGKALKHYLPGDYRGARRIINGADRAEMIAGYAEQFERALEDGGWA